MPLKDIAYPGLYMVGRTSMGWLASSSAQDGNVTTGFRNATPAQYYTPIPTHTRDGSNQHTTALSKKDVQCRGTIAPLGADSTSAFHTGAGLKNPRGPITMRRLLHSPGSTPATITTASGFARNITAFDTFSSSATDNDWIPPCVGVVPTGAPDQQQHPYLLLFYNNHFLSLGKNGTRDPYFLSVGWETRTEAKRGNEDNGGGAEGVGNPTILWSQPEVVLYDRWDHKDRQALW